MRWNRKKTVILAVLFGLLIGSDSFGQRYWRTNVMPKQTTTPVTNCVDGSCPTTEKVALKVEEEKTQPVVKSEVAESVVDSATGLESSVSDGETEPVFTQTESIDPMRAECLLRGNAVVDTSNLYAMGNNLVWAASLPEDDSGKFTCLLFHRSGDAESKALWEAWKKTEKLRVMADPLVHESKATKCHFSTVNVDDVTQQDIVKKYHVGRTPCVIVLSPARSEEGIPSHTMICRLEGYDGQPEAYADKLLLAFRNGLTEVLQEGVRAGRINPNIPTIKTLERDEITPQAGLDVKIVVPEELSQSVDSLGEKLLHAVYIVIACLFLLFGLIPLIIKGLPIVCQCFSSVWDWYKNILSPTKPATEDANAHAAIMAALLAKIEQLESKFDKPETPEPAKE
ncbi:MAG: hypothetical protein Q4D62_15605 [Planctomycetia bacterium]|nr:hypothetical protein [Planctomycetia bacterium]